MNKPIYVTRPFLPPLEEFNEYLKEIWSLGQLTNGGKFHNDLEQALCDYLGVKYISLFANGTLALINALQALEIKGEVITTPYSFVATAHSLLWNKITPVFVDVDPIWGNINSEKLEAAITEKTSALLPVHVYGNPCNHHEIKALADKYNLKLIYDAAHCFGVKERNTSVTNYGDLSILSFHATKVFNTFEGGAIVCHSKEMKQRIDDLKNFGFRNETTVIAAGINAKMNEIQAAFGLLQLKYVDKAIAKRKEITELYRAGLKNTNGIRILHELPEVEHNYSYFPVFIDETEYGKSRDNLYELLKNNGVFARRYFYPLISEFPMYTNFPSSKKTNLPMALKVSTQVLCLPIYPDLQPSEVFSILSIIND